MIYMNNGIAAGQGIQREQGPEPEKRRSFGSRIFEGIKAGIKDRFANFRKSTEIGEEILEDSNTLQAFMIEGEIENDSFSSVDNSFNEQDLQFTSYAKSRLYTKSTHFLEKIREVRKKRALKNIANLTEKHSEKIRKDLSIIQAGIMQKTDAQILQDIGLAGALGTINMTIANIAEVSLDTFLAKIALSNASPEAKAIASTILAYNLATIMVGPPSFAGLVRYLLYSIPEEIIVKTINISRKKRAGQEGSVGSLIDIKKMFSLQQLSLILEGASPILFTLEFLRALGLDVSSHTVSFLASISILTKK